MASDSDSSSLAFSIHLIREKIFRHVIWLMPSSNEDEILDEPIPDRRKLNLRDLKSLRSVNRSWLETTLFLLRNSKHPVLNIRRKCTCRNHQRPIDAFLKMMRNDTCVYSTLSSGETQRIPQLSLKLEAMDIDPKPQALAYYLKKFGSELVEMEFQFPVDVDVNLNHIGKFTLPKLQKLSVNLHEEMLMDHDYNEYEDDEERLTSRRSQNFQMFLQRILKACTELKLLRFIDKPSNSLQNAVDTELDYFPRNFSKLVLPDTLTTLEFQCPLKNHRDLKLMITLENPLPYLSSLTLFAFPSPFRKELIFEIFKKLANTLVNLSLNGAAWTTFEYNTGDRELTIFRFPFMSKLKRLRVESGRWVLDHDAAGLVDNLPKLETIALIDCLKEEEFAGKWTDNKTYAGIKMLTLKLVQLWDWDEDGIDFDPPPLDETPLTIESMLMTHTAFPNVTKLSLWFELTPEVADALSYIFEEVRQLKMLKLVMPQKEGNYHLLPEGFFDSILTGLSAERLAELRQLTNDDLEMKSTKELQNDDNCNRNSTPSIRNLIDLESLLLACDCINAVAPAISNISFYFGFFRIPKLRNLELAKGFLSSNEMKRKWEENYGGKEGDMRYYRYYPDIRTCQDKL